MATAKKTNPALWKRIVSRITKQASHGTAAGRWSARKAIAAVKAYKAAGGGYSGKKSSKNSLSKWSKQKWRTPSGKKSSETGEVYAPSNTIAQLEKTKKGRSKLARANRIKRKATKEGKQHARHGLHKGKKR